MSLERNIFNSVEELEPRCPNCSTVLDYGENTTYNDKKQCHICNSCGFLL